MGGLQGGRREELTWSPWADAAAPVVDDLTVTDTVISIGLKKGMRWPTSTTGESSTLFLQSLVVDQHGSSNQLKNAAR